MLDQENTDSSEQPKLQGGEASISSDWVGADLIRAERLRQIESEGWSEEHDDGHSTMQLSRAALCIMVEELRWLYITSSPSFDPPPGWPWEAEAWRKIARQSVERKLVIAGALIAAELDRLHRERTKDKLAEGI